MRAVRLLVLLLALVLLGLPATGAAQAAAKPRLVVKSASATLVGNQIAVTAKVKNKARKRAKAGEVTVFLTGQTVGNASGTTLGTLPTPRIRAKRAKTVSGQLAVPANASGTYRVVVCAGDSCATAGDVALPVRIAAAAGPGGTVALSGVTGGTCAGTSCTFAPGSGTVTFTPQAATGQRFVAWTGCTGYAAGQNGAITFTAPGTSATCTATFTPVVTLEWAARGDGFGSIAATATDGSCTATAPTGSCTVDAGKGSVTFTPVAGPMSQFFTWTPLDGRPCSAAGFGAWTFTAPTQSMRCAAFFQHVG